MTTATSAAAAAPATETPVTITPDAFDAAFNEAIQATATETSTPAAAAVPIATKTPAATTTPTTPAPATTITPAAPDTTQTTTPTTPAPATTTTPAASDTTQTTTPTTPAPATTTPVSASDPDAARKLAEEAARKIADEAVQKAATEKAEREAAEAREIKDPVLTTEQTAQLATFERDWPDVAAAVKIKMAHDINAIEARFARALTSIVGKVYDDIAPLVESVGKVETNSFRTAILAAHADYDTAVAPNLEGWIKKQPAYLTDGYMRVYNEGNVQEFTDLVNRFKEASGIRPQESGSPAPSSPSSPSLQSANQPTAAAKTAAAELAPVTAKRTMPTQSSEDPNDFDGAFAVAAAAHK